MPRPPQSQKIELQLSNEINDRINALCRELHASVSTILEHLLRFYVEDYAWGDESRFRAGNARTTDAQTLRTLQGVCDATDLVGRLTPGTILAYARSASILPGTLDPQPRVLKLAFVERSERPDAAFLFEIVGAMGAERWTPGRLFLSKETVLAILLEETLVRLRAERRSSRRYGKASAKPNPLESEPMPEA